MAGMGLGTARPGVVPPSLPLGDLTWASGFWFDLVAVPGADGAAITAPIASVAGSNVMTPASNPLVRDTAIAGRRGAYVADTGVANTQPRFTCNAAAPILAAASAFCIGLDFRQTKVAQMPLWVARSSVGGVTDEISGYSTLERAQLRYVTGGVLTTITGNIPLVYDYHRIVWDYDGATLRIYVDGVLDVAVAVVFPAFAVNLLTCMAGVAAGVAFAAATGFIRHWFLSPSSCAAGIATIDAYLLAQNYVLPYSASPKIATPGDSITNAGSKDVVNAAGFRGGNCNNGFGGGLAQYIIDERLSFEVVGDHEQGIIPNRKTSSTSGQSVAQIRDMLLASIAAENNLVFSLFMCGDGDFNSGATAATVAGRVDAAARAVLTAGIAKVPYFRIWMSTLIGMQVPPNGPELAQIQDYNANYLPGIVAQLNIDFPDAVYPALPRVSFSDSYAAIGPWSGPPLWSDGTHQAHPGSELIAVPMWDSCKDFLRAVSPT